MKVHTLTQKEGRSMTVHVRTSLPATARYALEEMHADHFPVSYTPAFFTAVMGGDPRGMGSPDAPPPLACVLVAASSPHDVHDLLGVATGRILPDDSPLSATGYVSTIAVDTKLRGAGLGAVLLDAILEQLYARTDQLGCVLSDVRLHVLADNAPALGLYYKAGFTIDHFAPEHYIFGGAHHDAFLLTRPGSLPPTSPPRTDAREAAARDAAAARSFWAYLIPGRDVLDLMLYAVLGVSLLALVSFGVTYVVAPKASRS